MMWTLFVTLVAFSGALYFISRPFTQVEGAAPEPEAPEDDEAPLEEIYVTLNELDFDRRTGKLSDEDYQRLSLQCKRAAAQILMEKADRFPDASFSRPADPKRRERIEKLVERQIREELERRKRGEKS